MAVDASLAHGVLNVRREVPVEATRPDAPTGRLDIVAFGAGFTLGIENKIESSEHSNQTMTYWTWLMRQHGTPAAIFLSPSGVSAVCEHFFPLTYLDLLCCLLEAPASGCLLGSGEMAVLAGYCKALASGVLVREIRMVLEE